MDTDREYIKNLIEHHKESLKFFSNNMRPQREKAVCAAFLRCLGVAFSVEDIIATVDDPPDVIFGPAQFEIMELLDENRKRTDEFRNRLNSLYAAKFIEDTLISIEPPSPISMTELVRQIFQALNLKRIKYGKRVCSELDALVYVCLSNRFLDANSVLPEYQISPHQAWRSVSFVFPPYASVLCCNQSAASFLSSIKNQIRSEWQNPDTLFDL